MDHDGNVLVFQFLGTDYPANKGDIFSCGFCLIDDFGHNLVGVVLFIKAVCVFYNDRDVHNVVDFDTSRGGFVE